MAIVRVSHDGSTSSGLHLRFAMMAAVGLWLGMPAAQAQSRDAPRPTREKAATQPSPRARATDPCLQYGAGFARVAGTDTCVKIGGSVGIGGSVNGNAMPR